MSTLVISLIGLVGIGAYFMLLVMMHKHLSRWSELEDYYSLTKRFAGECFIFKGWFASAYILNSPLTIGLDEEGICIKPFILFRLNHHTLFIPWDEVSIEDKRKLFERYLKLKFKKTPSIDLFLNKSTAENIIKWEFDPKKKTIFQRLLSPTVIYRGLS